MINRMACVELLDFLNSIEGHGYGGMASYENARLRAKIALEMFDKQRAAARPEDIHVTDKMVARAHAEYHRVLGDANRSDPMRAALYAALQRL